MVVSEHFSIVFLIVFQKVLLFDLESPTRYSLIWKVLQVIPPIFFFVGYHEILFELIF